MEPTGTDITSLCRELDLAWTEADLMELEGELSSYTGAMFQHLEGEVDIPSHIQGASSLCVPITSITDPYELYEEAEGSVSGEEFSVDEYDDYFVTVHFSEVPVVILLLKEKQGPLSKLQQLFDQCSRRTGRVVGGDKGAYFQWNQPGFGWTLHTDDEYEGVDSRVHVPLITTPQNVFCWAENADDEEEDWLLSLHLQRGKVYETRTDILHTAINRHPSKGRLHLILDVTRQPYNG